MAKRQTLVIRNPVSEEIQANGANLTVAVVQRHGDFAEHVTGKGTDRSLDEKMKEECLKGIVLAGGKGTACIQ